MTLPSPWQELEIEPTADVVAIRRAHRARLRRLTAAEADRLRAAYEGAIAASSPVPTPSVPPEAASPIEDALRKGDLVAAATLIAGGRADGTLSLRDDIAAMERLLILLTRPQATLDDIEQAASRLAWFDEDAELAAGTAFHRLRARLAAERWLRDTRRAADRTRAFDADAAAARRILGRRPLLSDRAVVIRPLLAALLQAVGRYHEWIGDRLDQAALDDARRIATPSP